VHYKRLPGQKQRVYPRNWQELEKNCGKELVKSRGAAPSKSLWARTSTKKGKCCLTDREKKMGHIKKKTLPGKKNSKKRRGTCIRSLTSPQQKKSPSREKRKNGVGGRGRVLGG